MAGRESEREREKEEKEPERKEATIAHTHSVQYCTVGTVGDCRVADPIAVISFFPEWKARP